MVMGTERWKLMDKMEKIRRRDLGEFIWRLWLKALGRIWKRLERYVPFPFSLFSHFHFHHLRLSFALNSLISLRDER